MFSFRLFFAHLNIISGYLGLFLSGVFVRLFIEKGNDTLFFQSVKSPTLDVLFYVITLVFEFPYLLLTFFMLLLLSIRSLALVLITYVMNAIITQGFKRFFEMPRPSRFFEMKGIHLGSIVADMEGYLPCCNGFPSGHTAAAFAICFTMLYIIRNVAWKWFFLVLAVLVAVSRVYLAVHFMEDVLFGSLLGMLIASFGYVYIWPALGKIPYRGIFSLS